MKTVDIVDLFCGAGGVSRGILNACHALSIRHRLTAVNHWKTAIDTHSLNHPEVRHLCQNVEDTNPRKLVPSGRLRLLAASCECIFHSNARGGGPCNEQSRSQPWQLIRWATDIHVQDILMENVPEWRNWGPLHGRTKRPIKSRRGEFFRAFLETLRNMGYSVEIREQVACDFGDATSRRRLMLIARHKNKAITWPEPTHGPTTSQPWRPARECIDKSIQGRSVFLEDGSLRHCKNTIDRMIVGFEKQGRKAMPFLLMLRGTSRSHIESSYHSLDEPLPAVCASGTHHLLCEPFIVGAGGPSGAGRPRSINLPMSTVLAENHKMLVEPFVMHITHQGSGGHERRCHSLERPLPTITTAKGGEFRLVEPMILKYYRTGICKSVNEPLDTITSKPRFMLVEPVTGVEFGLDIRTRMLQAHELAAAHSFPKEFKFTGNKKDQVVQVGNSVPVKLAEAHAAAVLK